MQTARRLYVYLLAGIGLGVLVSGISLLLTTLLEAIGLGSGVVVSGEQAIRERLTLATAMTAVSLPVWLIHWFVAERSVHPARAGAADERSSAIRGLFFALVLGGLLVAMFVSLLSLVEQLVLSLVGEDVTFGNPAGNLGLLVSAWVAWAYHLGVRQRDWRRGPISGAGAWLPRTYLYLATFVGLFVMVFGVADLLGLLGRLVTGGPDVPAFGDGGRWWSYPLALALSRITVGGLTWVGHWWYAGRLWADPGERGATERPARLRFAFFVAVLVVAAAATITYLGEAGSLAIGAVLGISDADGSPGGLLSGLLAAGAAATLFGAAWWLHAGWLRSAAEDQGAQHIVPRPERLVAYPTALVGLAAGAIGVARLLGLAFDLILGGGRVIAGGETTERAFAQFLPLAVLGAMVWLWHWATVRRMVAADPVLEAGSTIRRAALLLTLAVSVLAGVAALGVILYRGFGALFGLDVPGDVVAELSGPGGVLIVAVAVATVHGRLLRSDATLRAEGEAAAAEEAPGLPRPEVALRLVGPPGTEPGTLTGVTDALRAQLPDGFELHDARRMT